MCSHKYYDSERKYLSTQTCVFSNILASLSGLAATVGLNACFMVWFRFAKFGSFVRFLRESTECIRLACSNGSARQDFILAQLGSWELLCDGFQHW